LTDTFTPLVPPTVRTEAFRQAEEEARSRGYATGYAEGARRAEAELANRRAELEADFAAETRHQQARVDAQVRVLAAATAAADERLAPVLAEADNALAAAALDLAEAVLGAELSDSDTSARAILARVIDGVPADTLTTVRVSPDELPLIQTAAADLPGITFVADGTLSRGDAVAALPDGYLDARIGTAVSRARAALRGSR
jgi:flagellar assembly protein FliH